MVLPAKMPRFLKALYPNYVWDFFTESKHHNDKVLYLTFDDGPVPEATEFVLDTLNDHDAKATFFCIGDNVLKNPSIFNRLSDEGHAIGNHTQHHIEGWKTGTVHYIENVKQAETALTHHNPDKLFRPPYGRIKRKQGNALRQMGYHVVMWDVVAKDWRADVSKEDCLSNVIQNATNGSIVVLHDSIKALSNVRYALPRILDHFGGQGYRFKRIEGIGSLA